MSHLSPLDFAVTHEEHRFLSKITVVGECWEWSACRNRKGYGQFRIKRRTHPAHRVMYEWFYGPEEPRGLDVDHLCRNRACVNPLHLQAVTHAENVRRGNTGMYPHGIRTHCNHGHPFDEENTAPRSDGRGRRCRICSRQATARWQERKRREQG